MGLSSLKLRFGFQLALYYQSVDSLFFYGIYSEPNQNVTSEEFEKNSSEA